MAVRRNCEKRLLGRGRPRTLRLGIVARRSAPIIGFSSMRLNSLHRDPDQLNRETLDVASQMFGGVRTAMRTRPAPPSARSTAISVPLLPAPYHQHVLSSKELRIPVVRGMGKRSVEVALPSRQRWNSGVPASDHYYPGRNSASRSLYSPVAVAAVDPCSLNAEPQLEAVVRRVLLQVLHELITCYPAAEIARNSVTRKSV